MERGVHVIGEKCGLLRRALAAQRKRRQRIEAGRARDPALVLRRQHRRRVRERRSRRHDAGHVRAKELSKTGGGLDAQAGIEADGSRARAIAGTVRGLRLRRGQRLHHIPAPRAIERRPGPGLL